MDTLQKNKIYDSMSVLFACLSVVAVVVVSVTRWLKLNLLTGFVFAF